MIRRISLTLAAVLSVAGATNALALGTPPINGQGPALADQSWLYGLSGGLNNTYQSGLTATGTTQATALQLPSGIFMMETDTVSASTGVALPPCFQGTETWIYNNGAQNLTVYPSIANNPLLSPAAQDTINNSTSVTVNAHTGEAFICAKNGVWGAK